MTLEEIDKLEPGPELDRLIAIHIMGWRQDNYAPSIMDKDGAWFNSEGRSEHLDETRFSTDIAAAWMVVEHVCKQMTLDQEKNKFQIIYRPTGWDKNPGPFFVGFYREGDCKFDGETFSEWPYAFGSTAALAICRAGLKTAFIKGEQQS